MAGWREPRVAEELPVRVRGLDYDGNPFIQDTYTLNVSRRGARLEWVSALKGAGEAIEIQRGRKKARFRVVWIGQIGTAEDNQVGICSMEPEKYIWGVPLPTPVPVRRPLARSAPAKPVALTDSSYQHRRPRYRCGGGAQIWQEGSQSALSGTLSEISVGGCYIETTWPLPVGTQLEVLLKTNEEEVRARGVVGYLDPSLGMGVAFTTVSEQDRYRLQQLTHRLAARQS
jgi:hypothetical protein